MNTPLKRKIAFVLWMGGMTTGVISFVIIATNLGFVNGFVLRWLRSWLTAYAIVVPAMLVIAPRVQARVDHLIK